MAHAQDGPPLLTNDPGTPGDGNWEINLSVMQVLRQRQNVLQVPQIDLNFGLGNHFPRFFDTPGRKSSYSCGISGNSCSVGRAVWFSTQV